MLIAAAGYCACCPDRLSRSAVYVCPPHYSTRILIGLVILWARIMIYWCMCHSKKGSMNIIPKVVSMKARSVTPSIPFFGMMVIPPMVLSTNINWYEISMDHNNSVGDEVVVVSGWGTS